jgi:hypothetical protein
LLYKFLCNKYVTHFLIQSPIRMWNSSPQYIEIVYQKKVEIHTFIIIIFHTYNKVVMSSKQLAKYHHHIH